MNEANRSYQQGYADGYRRCAGNMHMRGGKKDEKMDEENQVIEGMTFFPMSYETAILFLIAIFLILIIILGYINQRPFGYATKYKDNCLLKLSTTYSGAECL